MFVAQLALSMVVWAVAIAMLARHRESVLRRMAGVPRGRRTGIAVSSMLGSVLLLGLGMDALMQGGMRSGSFTWWGWPVITLAGAGFVALQTFGLVPLMLNAVTAERPQPSDKKDSRRP